MLALQHCCGMQRKCWWFSKRQFPEPIDISNNNWDARHACPSAPPRDRMLPITWHNFSLQCCQSNRADTRLLPAQPNIVPGYNCGSMLLVCLFFFEIRWSFGVFYYLSKALVKFDAWFLRHVEKRVLLGLRPSNVTYFSLWFCYVREFGFYRAFATWLNDQCLRNRLRNDHFCE